MNFRIYHLITVIDIAGSGSISCFFVPVRGNYKIKMFATLTYFRDDISQIQILRAVRGA
jgi:hypothetical protein